MQLTKDEALDVLYGDHEDWEEIERQMVDTSRWSIHYEGIFRHIPSKKYYSMCWSVGATEQQDEGPFEYEEPELREVEQYDKIVKSWRSVKSKEST